MRYTVGVVLWRTLERITWLTRTAYANEVCPGVRFEIVVDFAESYTGTLHYASLWSDMPETSLYTRKYTVMLIVTGTCFRPHERNPSGGDPERLLGLTQLADNLTFFEQHSEYNSRRRKDMLFAIPAEHREKILGEFLDELKSFMASESGRDWKGTVLKKLQGNGA